MSINNPQAIKFCNENIRVAADKLAQAYYFAKVVMDEWSANNLGTLLPIDGGNVEDGAISDGRPVITGNDVTVMTYALNSLISDFEASNKTKLNSILRIAPNPKE